MKTDRIVVPSLQFLPPMPANLVNMIEAQAQCLIANGIHQEVGIDKAKFLDDAITLARQFTYSVELSTIRLENVWLVHYGARDRFLADVGEVRLKVDPGKFILYDGVTTPKGLTIVQGQLGSKYRDGSKYDIRQNHNTLEQLGIPKEGLTAYLYWGKPLFREIGYMDFPGAISNDDDIPHMHIMGIGAGPALDADSRTSNGGSVTVSRG